MFENFKFIVIEDVDRDREEVLNQLADAGFTPANLLARPTTLQEARDALRDHAVELDVVFLDLNLPRDGADPRPEKAHGRKILDEIHNSYNPKLGIRVVVVSGEDLLDGFSDQTMYAAWRGTLVSIAQKSALSQTMTASLKRLRKDPLAQRIRRAKLDEVLEHYECLVDAEQPAGERLKAARGLALRLARNEVDHHRGAIGATNGYADDLNGLIKDHIESRFAVDARGRRFVEIGRIESPGGWGAFLWRGATLQHLYTLNSYRNSFEHLREHPYDGGATSAWEVPRDALERASSGQVAAVVAEYIACDLLEWYLPWHEQIYMPWMVERG